MKSRNSTRIFIAAFIVLVFCALLTGCGFKSGDLVTTEGNIMLTDETGNVICYTKSNQDYYVFRSDPRDSNNLVWVWVKDPENPSCWGKALQGNFSG